MKTCLRVLVVDDSAMYRRIISSAIEKIDSARLCGYAKDGKEALDKVEMLKPDVVTLDVEMPIMNGLEALDIIHKKHPEVKVLMVSSLSPSAINSTIEAIEKSAFSFISKPDGADSSDIERDLTEQINAINLAKDTTSGILTVGSPKPTVNKPPTNFNPSFVAIGISTGGPKALGEVIPKFSKNLSIPVLIVQHMPAGFTEPLAKSLDSKSNVKVKEGENNETLQAGVIYIAPGGKHMRVAPNGVFGKIEITDDAPENFCKPSVNYLFRSLASHFGGKVLSVIMTGMGDDGTVGLKLLKRKGAMVFGQTAETCTVYGMPAAAQKAGVVDKEIKLENLASEIEKVIK